jgi:hypothetical protein
VDSPVGDKHREKVKFRSTGQEGWKPPRSNLSVLWILSICLVLSYGPELKVNSFREGEAIEMKGL